jgi:lysozyme
VAESNAQHWGRMSRGNRKLIRWGLLLLGLALASFALWNYVTGWAPSRDAYPVQGIVVNESNGQPIWAELGATGVDFAYITATEGARGRDLQFQANLAAVQEAGIRFGALHHFDLCRSASEQATMFITSVPRNDSALPPAVQLDFSEGCKSRPNRALILSELATFLNQIEAHSGTPAILLLTPAFEKEYRVSKSIDRNIWLEGNGLSPDYSARPWVMWTANTQRRLSGIDGAVRWVVVRK